MANMWKVKFIDDDDEDEIQVASFNSQREADLWIKNQEIQGRYDPRGFEVVEGPIKEASTGLSETEEKEVEMSFKTKVSTKLRAKSIARVGAKRGINNLSKKQLKFIEKVSKNAPKGAQKAIENGHKALEKAKNTSKMSRKMKRSLKDNNEQSLGESAQSMVKIWVDDVRPAPNGYVWLKSVGSFIDYLVEHGIQDIAVFDFDYDAGEYASDGGDYIKCLDYLESIGADGINVRIHSANSVGLQKMRQIIQKNQWNEVHSIFESTLAQDEQVQMLFESFGPNEETFGETWDLLGKDSIGYQIVVDSLKDGNLQTIDVYKVQNHDHFVAVVGGRDNGSCDPQRWLRCLESIKKFIGEMLSHGCGDVWLLDVNTDVPDGVFTLRVGFQLLSSPFSSDGNKPIEEVEELDEAGVGDKSLKDPIKKKGSGPEDSAAKDKIVDKLKDLAGDFNSKASNNDPEQFAKIKVAFDDLASAVGDYDFKEKRVLKEFDNSIALDGVFAKIKQDIEDAGAVCDKIDQGLDGIIHVYGEFHDTLQLESLILWYLDGHWHEGTKCRNKWREVATAIFDKHLPNGVLVEKESQDGLR